VIARRPRRSALLVDSLFSVRNGFDRDACERRIEEVAQSGGEWIVAWHGDYALGWVVLRYDGKRSHPEYPDLSDLFVREEARGQGIGTALIRRAEALAAARGHTRIGLAVNPTENVRARQLYERLGFTHDGRAMYLDGTYDGAEDWVIDLERPL
jgi:GNAT superfamily N-acetyltransferase